MEALQHLIPWLSIRTCEHGRGLRVANDLLPLSIPPDFSAEAHRDVGQMASGGHAMLFFEIGDGLLPRLDAIDEVAGVRGQQIVVDLPSHRLAPRWSRRIRRVLRAGCRVPVKLG